MSLNLVRSITPPLIPIAIRSLSSESLGARECKAIDLFVEAGFCDAQGLLTFIPEKPPLEPDGEKLKAVQSKTVTFRNTTITVEEYINKIVAKLNEKWPLCFKIYLRGSYASFILHPKMQLRWMIDQFVEKHPEKHDVMERAWKWIEENNPEPIEPVDVDWAIQLDFPPDMKRVAQFRSALIELHSKLAGVRKGTAKNRSFDNLLIPKVDEWNLSADPVVISSVKGDSIKLDVAIGFLNTTFMCARDNHCVLLGAATEATTMLNSEGFYQSILDNTLACYRLKKRHATDFSVSIKLITALMKGKSINESTITLKEIIQPFLKNGSYNIFKYINKKLKNVSINKTAFLINFLSLIDDIKLRDEIWRWYRPKSRSFDDDATQIFEQKRAFPSLYGNMPLHRSNRTIKPDLQFMKKRLFAEADPQEASPDCFYAEWRKGCEALKQQKPVPVTCISSLVEMFLREMFTQEEEQIVDFSRLVRQPEFVQAYKSMSLSSISQCKNADLISHLEAIGGNIPPTEKKWVVSLWIECVNNRRIPLKELLLRIPAWFNSQFPAEMKEAMALTLLESGLVQEHDALQICMHNVRKEAFHASLHLIPEELQAVCVLNYPEEAREELEEDLSAKKLKVLWHKTLSQTRSIFTLWKMERRGISPPEKMAEEITTGFITQARSVGLEAEEELKEQIICLQVNALQLLTPKLQPEMRAKAVELSRSRILNILSQGDLEGLEVFLNNKFLQTLSGITAEELRTANFSPQQTKSLLDLLQRCSMSNPFLQILCEKYLELDYEAHSKPAFCHLLLLLESAPDVLAKTLVRGILEAPDAYLDKLNASHSIPESLLYQLYPVYQKHELQPPQRMVRSILEHSTDEVVETVIRKVLQNELELDADLMMSLLTHHSVSFTFEELKNIESRNWQGLHDKLRILIESKLRHYLAEDKSDEVWPHLAWLETKVRDIELRKGLKKIQLQRFLERGIGSSQLLLEVTTPNEAFRAFRRLKKEIDKAPEIHALSLFLTYCLKNKIMGRGPAKTILCLLNHHPQLSASKALLDYALFCSQYDPLELDDRISLLHTAFEGLGSAKCKRAFVQLARKAQAAKEVSVNFTITFLKLLCRSPHINLPQLEIIVETSDPQVKHKLEIIASLKNLNQLLKNYLPYPGNFIDNLMLFLKNNLKHNVPTYEESYIELIVKTLHALAPSVAEKSDAGGVKVILDAWFDTLTTEHASKAWIAFMESILNKLEKEHFPYYLQILLQLTKLYYENRHKNLERFTAEFSWLLNKCLSHPFYDVNNNYSQFILAGLNLMKNTRLMYFYCLFSPSEEDTPFHLTMRARMREPNLEIIEKALNLAALRCDISGIRWSEGIAYQITGAIRNEAKLLRLMRKVISFQLQMGLKKEVVLQKIKTIMTKRGLLKMYDRILKESFTKPPKAQTTLTQAMFEEAVASIK